MTPTPIMKKTSLAVAMSPLYKTAIDTVTALQKRYAASMLARLTSARDADALANRAVDRSVHQFSSQINPRSADGPTASDSEDVPDDAPFVDHLNNGSSRVWSTPSCRPMQHIAVERALFEKECEGKLLIVDCTGGGKAISFAWPQRSSAASLSSSSPCSR